MAAVPTLPPEQIIQNDGHRYREIPSRRLHMWPLPRSRPPQRAMPLPAHPGMEWRWMLPNKTRHPRNSRTLPHPAAKHHVQRMRPWTRLRPWPLTPERILLIKPLTSTHLILRNHTIHYATTRTATKKIILPPLVRKPPIKLAYST